MPVSVYGADFQETLRAGACKGTREIDLNGQLVTIETPYPSPADWRDQVIYFLIIDRFNNPDADPQATWDQEYDYFQGGVIKGITEKLDYIRSLGATAIWMTPPFKNCQYNNTSHTAYGIQDFLQIDPRFGSEEDLRELVDQAHARGMYIICDIVLNHVGDVFAYQLPGGQIMDELDYRDTEYDILWRNGQGEPKWSLLAGQSIEPDAGIWPEELQQNRFFRRKGRAGGEYGDFYSLRELVTETKDGALYPVRDTLIKCYQYLIAKFDIDGMRIDTLKHIERDFARIFGNAIREFALSIGKKNFFTFGEITGDEEKITQYIGRYTHDEYGVIGVDAALDFPVFNNLPPMLKGYGTPWNVAKVFEERKHFQRDHLSSHGEAGKYFVTFIDNHDQHSRYYPNLPQYANQVSMAMGALLTLQGIPCIYYGTEQGLSGSGGRFEAVREALWGKPNAFDQQHPFYVAIQRLAEVRNSEPALRYGRQYFRQLSGNGQDFGFSRYNNGVLAYGRILGDTEILVVINCLTAEPWTGQVLIDYDLNQGTSQWQVLYSNQRTSVGDVPVSQAKNAVIEDLWGGKSYGEARVVEVSLEPMELLILKRR